MTSQEYFWLAGLLEGDGCFHTYSTGYNKGRPGITLEMADRDVVRRVAEMWGVKIGKGRWGASQYHRQKPTYRISVTGHAAAHWCRLLRPMMGKRRRKKIDAVLKAWTRRLKGALGEH